MIPRIGGAATPSRLFQIINLFEPLRGVIDGWSYANPYGTRFNISLGVPVAAGLVEYGYLPAAGGAAGGVIVVAGGPITWTVVGGAVVITGATIAAVYALDWIIQQTRTPAKGEPESTDTFSGPGGHTVRTYGKDGRATKDVDYGHDHGQGDPHVHDWDWSKNSPRQPGRPPRPGEIP
jgi:hypothetical protein